MPTLRTAFAGIDCLNPFWLASAPPTNCGEQIMRAFDAGWGGAVWKTIGESVTNVSSRYSSIDWNGQKMMGFNNIELISDRPIATNLREIAEVKRHYPKHVVIASLMVESKRETWHDIVARAEDAGADGLELNFGCPHGMSERGMGSAVGQVPEYCEQITELGQGEARAPRSSSSSHRISPIFVCPHAPPSRGGADALSAINTHQLHHQHRPRHIRAQPRQRGRRQKLPRRLLRSRGQADCAQHGASRSLSDSASALYLSQRYRRHR